MNPETPAPAVRCLGCQAALPPEGIGCLSCGHSLEGVRVYDPKRFVLLAFLFTGLAPLWMATANWGRLGERKRKRRWLLGGLAMFVAVTFVALALPDLDSFGSSVLFTLVSLSIAGALRDKQRPLYRAARALGARRASTLFGSLVGFSLGLVVLFVALAAFVVQYEVRLGRGVSLRVEGRCEESASVMERLWRSNPEHEIVNFELGMAHVCLENWTKAELRMRTYLSLLGDEDAEAFAVLGFVLENLEKGEEAERYYARARELDPNVMQRLFSTE